LPTIGSMMSGAMGARPKLGAHAVQRQFEVRHRVEHGAVEVDDGGPDGRRPPAFIAPTAASSARMASITAL
jgi:hypothetical protein